MKGKLFLGGGGSSEQSAPLDKEFKKSMKGKTRVLLITLARSNSEKTFKWFKKAYADYKFKDVVVFREGLDEKKILELDAVYIGGGNTYRLLNNLRKFKLIEVLKKFHEIGKPIYGGSAGAVIIGETIATAAHQDTNEEGLTNLSGLDIIKGFSIVCHYSEKEGEIVKKYALNNKVLCIPEDAGIIIEDGSIRIVGSNCLCLVKGIEKQLKKGESYQLSTITQ